MQQSNSLSLAYREISERHLDAARLVLEGGRHEIAVFHCYHAFESIACAALALQSSRIPRTHAAKINRFIQAYKYRSFGFSASALGSILPPMRNRTLYPDPALLNPRDAFTVSDARNFITRVNGFVRSVIRELTI
jgi:HEPN domain-containing protein